VQTAKSCGLPDKMVKEVIQELTDTTASGIDQTLSHLPEGFPETIAASISSGVRQRLKSLPKTEVEG
jgi:serine/threonine-protein kinase HipA